MADQDVKIPMERGGGEEPQQGLRARGKWSQMKKELPNVISKGKRLRPGGLSDTERQSALTMLMLVVLLGEMAGQFLSLVSPSSRSSGTLKSGPNRSKTFLQTTPAVL